MSYKFSSSYTTGADYCSYHLWPTLGPEKATVSHATVHTHCTRNVFRTCGGWFLLQLATGTAAMFLHGERERETECVAGDRGMFDWKHGITNGPLVCVKNDDGCTYWLLVWHWSSMGNHMGSQVFHFFFGDRCQMQETPNGSNTSVLKFGDQSTGTHVSVRFLNETV